ncbi:MAG: rod shape-determining protein MreD [Gammaproteobacteria bacterium]
MRFTNSTGNATVILSIVIAMGLRILPWSRDWVLFNPDWILLIVIYWCLTIPERFNIGSTWVVGLLTDALTGQLLGYHALNYSVVSYIVVRLHLRIRLFRLTQQIFMVLCLLSLSQLIVFWMQNIQGAGYISWTYWIPSISGAMIWPLVYFLLGGSHQQEKID